MPLRYIDWYFEPHPDKMGTTENTVNHNYGVLLPEAITKRQSNLKRAKSLSDVAINNELVNGRMKFVFRKQFGEEMFDLAVRIIKD